MYRFLITLALIITSGVVCLPHAQNRESAAELRPTQTAFLEGHLLRLGEQYDVYFTLETAWQEKESMNWMEQYKVGQFSKDKRIQRELDRLTESVPHFTYIFDSANPRIIHIKDARLGQQPSYGLEDLINNVNYKGTWMGLVNALAERGIKVSTLGLTWIGDMRARDYSTQVHVKARNIRARDAITNFIEIPGRRRILWLSTTKLAPGEVSYIQLYDTAKKP